MNKCCQTCNKALTDHYLCGKTNKIVKSSDLCSDYSPQLDNNGWDVVKEIKQMCEDEQLIPNYEEDNYEAGFNDAKYDIIDFIKQKLQEAEIGVKDENK